MPSSGSVPPEEVMTMLNELFAKFDELTTIHGVYKVETVGGKDSSHESMSLLYQTGVDLLATFRRVCCELRRA